MKTFAEISKTAQDRMDSVASVLTGLGTRSDKARSYQVKAAPDFPDEWLEELYDGSGLCAKLVDKFVQEMFREGFELLPTTGKEGGRSEDDEAEAVEVGRQIKQALKDHGFIQGLREGERKARLFGGAVMWPQVTAPGELYEPLDFDSVTGLEGNRVIDARYVRPYELYTEGPKIGDVATYQIRPETKRTGAKNAAHQPSVVIHETRLIKFMGLPSVSSFKNERPGWGKSVLEKYWHEIVDYLSTWLAITHLTQDSAQAVIYIKGLYDILSTADGESKLINRLSFANIQRSITRMFLMESEEKFERHQHQMNGLEKIAESQGHRVAMVADMPNMVLFGKGPTGLQNDGGAEMKNWSSTVAAFQEEKIEPKVQTCIKILQAAKLAPVTESVEVRFNSILVMTPSEKAEIRAKNASANASEITSQVLLPEEVALSQYHPSGYSSDISIRRDIRKRALDVAAENMVDRMTQMAEGDEEEAEGGADGGDATSGQE